MNTISEKYHDISMYSEDFKKALPFPHIVFDDFLNNDIYKNISQNLNKMGAGEKFDSQVEKNKWISRNSKLPDSLKRVISDLNSSDWINQLYKLSNIDQLFGTTVGNTKLANFHIMSENGFLGSHVDHSMDPETNYPHVLNIILYLTSNWRKNWGGGTTLMNYKGNRIVKTVNYVPNRAVIFLHTPYSFHGVSNIKNNSSNRATIYVDYYSKNFDPFSNLKLPFKNKWFKHSTCFVLPRLIDYFKLKNIYYTKTRIKYLINNIKSR